MISFCTHSECLIQKEKKKTAGKQADDQLAFCYLLSLMRPPNWDVREARILVRAGCMWLAVAIPVKHKQQVREWRQGKVCALRNSLANGTQSYQRETVCENCLSSQLNSSSGMNKHGGTFTPFIFDPLAPGSDRQTDGYLVCSSIWSKQTALHVW